MTPISFLAGAAAGAAASWAVRSKSADGELMTLRAELEAARSDGSSHQRALAEARARVQTLETQVTLLQEVVEASRGETRAAHEQAEVHRRAAAVTLEEATARAKDVVRAEVERQAQQRAQQVLADAKAQAESMTRDLKTRDERLALLESAVTQKDQRLAQREAELSSRDRAVTERERAVAQRESVAEKLVAERTAALEAVRASEKEALERVAALTGEEARSRVIDEIMDDARRSGAREAKQIEDLAREEAEKRAKRVIGIAVQRYAGEYAGERAVTSVHLPSDELKGRIIGREGRNIRTFQEVTGCDLVIDDTPETIVVSSFDPVRREMARLTLERLIQDGRIHPSKIEEFFIKSKEEVERTIKEAGEAAAMELGIGRLHPDLVKIVGQLRYRYSYAQNILRHSVEVAHMCGLLAQEMGINPKLAKRAGLLHDIGKGVTHEVEGGHAVIGGQMARKAGEDDMVVNAIAAHHDDEPPRSVLAHLTAAADAISGARPGARREMLEGYVRRLEDLERICGAFKGVERSFAIQAGREVRVLVEPSEIDDAGALALSRDIARKIESELAYPGQVKVTVVRETRAVDYAR